MANDSGHRWFWRNIAGATVAYVWTSVVLPYIAPLGATLIAMLLALAAEPKIPWMYIWVAMLVSFAMTSVGILRLNEMLERRRVKDKLNFAKMRFGRNIHGPGVFLDVWLPSSASVPIEFEVEQVRTRVNNRVPAQELDIAPITIPPNGTGFVDDHVIDIGEPPRPGTLEGFAEFKIKYGRVGRAKHDLIIRKQVVLAFNADGLFEGGSQYDAN